MAMGRVLAAFALAGAAACSAGVGASANSVSVNASAGTLKNDGSTVLITAASADATGGAGTGSVTFSTSIGSLGANGDRFVTVPLTADGVASVEFSCNSATDSRCAAGTALLNAKWNDALAHVVVAIVDAGSTGATGGTGGTTAAPTLSVKSTTPSTIQPTGGTTTSSVVTFSLLDSSGAGVSGKTIALAEQTGEALVTLSTPTLTTDAAGAASVTVTSKAATGTAHLTATVAGSTPLSFAVSVVAPAAAPVLSVKSTTPSTIQPLGGTTTSSVVTFSLVDSSSAGVSSKTIAVAEQAGESLVTLSAPTVTTDASGAASVTVSSSAGAGTAHLTATVAGSTPASFTVSIVAPPPTLAVTGIAPASMSTADGASFGLATSANVTFSVLDFANKPVANQSIAIAEQTGETLVTVPATVKTDASGTATVTVSSGALTGTAHLTATVPGSTPVSFTVQLTAVPRIIVANDKTTLLGLRGSGIQEHGSTAFLVTDATGVPVPGITVAFAEKAPQLVSITANTVVTDDKGIAVARYTAASDVGVTSITASVPATGATTSAIVAVRGARPSASGFYFRCERASLPVYTTTAQVETMTCTVRLADRFGNRVGIPTAVSFATEAGTITANAVTKPFDPADPTNPDEGTAMVTFSTDMGNGNDPIDVNRLAADAAQYPWPRIAEPFWTDGSLVVNPRDQLVTIVAMTRGEEAFVDANRNGKYDSKEAFVDQGDPFVDVNDDGEYGLQYDLAGTLVPTSAGGEWEQWFCGGALDPVTNAPEDCLTYHGPNGVWDADTEIWKPTWVVFTGIGAASTTPPGAVAPKADFSFACADYVDANTSTTQGQLHSPSISADVYVYDHWLNFPSAGTKFAMGAVSASQVTTKSFGFGDALDASGSMGTFGLDFDWVRVAANDVTKACDIAGGEVCVERLRFGNFSDGEVGFVLATNTVKSPVPGTPAGTPPLASKTGYGCNDEGQLTGADQYGSASFLVPIEVTMPNGVKSDMALGGRVAVGTGK